MRLEILVDGNRLSAADIEAGGLRDVADALIKMAATLVKLENNELEEGFPNEANAV